MKMGNRTKQWTFIVYPDSAPKDWEKILRSQLIPCLISPLHSPESDGTEEELKQHWHVFLDYDGQKTIEQAKQVTTLLNATNPQKVQAASGLVRYFIHLGYPEKEQFNRPWEQLVPMNGFDVTKYDKLTDAELDKYFREITKFIDDNEIFEYSDLIALSRDDESDEMGEWFKVIRRNTIFFTNYITSRRNQYKDWLRAIQEQKRHD